MLATMYSGGVPALVQRNFHLLRALLLELWIAELNDKRIPVLVLANPRTVASNGIVQFLPPLTNS